MAYSKTGRFKVTKKMCAKVYPAIKPGDLIEISFSQKPLHGRFVLISEFEEQWIDRYHHRMKRKNMYPITKIILMD
jgi:hypothetical protein